MLLALAAYFGGRALPRAWLHLNTDFPNYYVTSRLLRDGYSAGRAYEWIWLQRQKDRLGILRSDQTLIGFIPHTPFSALFLWPLTHWPPLTAKRIWVVCTLLLVGAVAALLRPLTDLEWRHIALLIGLNYPLMRNLEYGQYYVLLLFLITAALWLYLHNRRLATGLLLGIAAGLKIFPALFILYFARKRDWQAGLGLICGALATVAASVAAFGLQLHRVYLLQVLPWALRGEANDPYNLASSSFSSLLHRLLIYEPQLNPHAAMHAPAAFAVLHPLLQMLVFAPAVMLASPENREAHQVQLEWASFVVALLAISTLPASYHFTLLIIPIAVLASVFAREKKPGAFVVLMALYSAICFPAWPRLTVSGWWALIAVPRLWFLLMLCTLCYISQLQGQQKKETGHRMLWAAALALIVIVQAASTLSHQRGVYERYSSRIMTAPDVLLAAEPVVRDGSIDFIAMKGDRYSASTMDRFGVQFDSTERDQLSRTAAGPRNWVEEAGSRSQIMRIEPNTSVAQIEVSDAEFPIASPDGKLLAYLRSDSGRSSLWLRSFAGDNRPDVRLTRDDVDVEEMTFLPSGDLIFAGRGSDGRSALYNAAGKGAPQPLHIEEARYPGASPDGRWLAYSKLERGVWNLWLQDLHTGATRRLTNDDCNDIEPAWAPDSRTLVYASDCARALWQTALVRQQVVP